MKHLQGQLYPTLSAQDTQVHVEGPNVGDTAEPGHVTEKALDEDEVLGGAEGRDEARVSERVEREAPGEHGTVVALGEVEAGVAREGADEAVVVDGEDAASGVGHLVEQLDGAVDEAGFDAVGYAGSVQKAVSAQTVNHIRSGRIAVELGRPLGSLRCWDCEDRSRREVRDRRV